VEAHLGSDLVEGPGQEVGGAHPGPVLVPLAHGAVLGLSPHGDILHFQSAIWTRVRLRRHAIIEPTGGAARSPTRSVLTTFDLN
jgi:hypothetical protein